MTQCKTIIIKKFVSCIIDLHQALVAVNLKYVYIYYREINENEQLSALCGGNLRLPGHLDDPGSSAMTQCKSKYH